MLAKLRLALLAKLRRALLAKLRPHRPRTAPAIVHIVSTKSHTPRTSHVWWMDRPCEEVKTLVSKLQCTVFVNVVTEFVDCQWQYDEEGATTLLKKIVPDDFSAQVARQLAIMWPTAAGYKIQAQESHTSSHTSMACFVQTIGTRVFNVAIGKLNSREGLSSIMKDCGKHPLIIGGGIEANEHLLAMYAKDNNRSDVRILTTSSQYPVCKCILLTPGMDVKFATSPTTSPTINVIPLTLQPLRRPHATEHGRPECKVSHAQPQKDPAVDANSATSSSHQQLRPHATEPGRPEREISCFGALGDPDIEDVFVALLASILKEACPCLSSIKLEKATRKAVQRNPLLADDKAAPVIRSGVSRSWFAQKWLSGLHCHFQT